MEWPNEHVRDAFALYWNLRCSGADYRKLFALEAPHFQSMVSPQAYRNYLRTRLLAEPVRVEVIDILEMTEHLLEISFRLSFLKSAEQEQEITLRERWVLVDGTWYHVLLDPLTFPI